ACPLIVPGGLRTVVSLAVGLAEAPRPTLLLGECQPIESGAAADAGRLADRCEEQDAGLPGGDGVVATAEVAHESHVALALLLDLLDRRARQAAGDARSAAVLSGNLAEDRAETRITPGAGATLPVEAGEVGRTRADGDHVGRT